MGFTDPTFGSNPIALNPLNPKLIEQYVGAIASTHQHSTPQPQTQQKTFRYPNPELEAANDRSQQLPSTTATIALPSAAPGLLAGGLHRPNLNSKSITLHSLTLNLIEQFVGAIALPHPHPTPQPQTQQKTFNHHNPELKQLTISVSGDS